MKGAFNMRRFITMAAAMLMAMTGIAMTAGQAQSATNVWYGYHRCAVAGHSDYAVGAWWLVTTDKRTMVGGVAWKPYGDAGILPDKVSRFHIYQYYNGVLIRIVDLDVVNGWSGSEIFSGPASALRPTSGANAVVIVPISAATGAGLCSVTSAGP